MSDYLYQLQIAGIIVLLDSDYEIKFRHNTTPFLIRDAEAFDFVIRIRKTHELTLKENGIYFGDRYYLHTKESDDFYLMGRGNKPGFHSGYKYSTNEWNVLYTGAYEKYIKVVDVLLGFIGIENLLRYKHGFFLHSSLIKWKNQMIMFCAPSGTGKSTQAALWEKYENADIVNGDRACVRKIDGSWYAYGSPYAGSSKIYVNDGGPVNALFLLKQAPVNRTIQLSAAETVKMIFPEIVMHHWDQYFVDDVLNYLKELIHDIPVFVLECTLDINAVREAKKITGD